MSFPLPLVLVVAVALIEEGRALLCQRLPGKHLAGLWEFPGGKLEEGESPEAALIREIHEELSIELQISNLTPLTFVSYPYDHFHLLMPFYTASIWKGSVQAMEGQELAWVPLNQLEDYPMPVPDTPLIQYLQQYIT